MAGTVRTRLTGAEGRRFAFTVGGSFLLLGGTALVADSAHLLCPMRLVRSCC
jgi:hypothetical protein